MSPGNDHKPPFALQVGYDQPELLGARWWLEGTIAMAKPAASAGRRPATTDESRRFALKMLFGVGGALALGAFVVTRNLGSTTQVANFVDHNSLALQRARGLMTGSDIQKFTWLDTTSLDVDGKPFDRVLLTNLAPTLAPGRPDLAPFYVPTLFQSLQGLGSETLRSTIECVNTPAMRVAYARGEAMRELVQLAEQPQKWAIVVDLPGPDSVAFASGLQPAVDTVFTFDNWPHPRGVVPSHLTLGAVMFHHARFLMARVPTRLTPLFVLDRNRLATYRDHPQQFDNRYRAKLPTAAAMRELGIERVLYVVPEGAPADELDDLNDRFVEYRDAGIEVRLLGVGDFQPASAPAAQAAQATTSPSTSTGSSGHGGGTRYYWGGGSGYHYWFWNHYGWASRPGPVQAERPPTSAFGSNYRPTVRSAARQSLAQLGRTTTSERSGSSGRSSGGSWGRSSGGSFGG